MTVSLLPRSGHTWVQNTIFLSLTAMEMAWFAPLVRTFLPETWQTPPIITLVGLWALMLGIMIIAHFLESRAIPSPTFEIVVAGVLLFLGILAIRLFVFSDEPPLSIAWVGRLFSPGDDIIRIGIILGTVAFLWWRAVTFLQRDINFFIIGYDFRKGVLALLATTSFFRLLSGQSALLFIVVFFFFGLLAVALGRMEDKALTTDEGRAPIGRTWLGIVGLSVLAVTGIGWLFGQLWSLDGFQALWGAIKPGLVWTTPYARALIFLLLRPLEPVLEWLIMTLRHMMGGKAADEVFRNMMENMPNSEKIVGNEPVNTPPPGWLVILFSYVIPITLGLLVLFLLVFWLARRRQAHRSKPLAESHEQVAGMEGRGLRNALRRGLGNLKDLAGMVGRFGIGRDFYAAISIRHIYANLQKLAAERGRPRDPAWTPNDYLPQLFQAFPGQEEPLRLITAAYNDFEYGHVSTDPEDLKRMKAAWDALKTSPPAATATPSHDDAS